MRPLAILAALSLVACSNTAGGDSGTAGSSGTGSMRNFAVSGFTGVDLAGSDDVDVRVGTAFSVRAEGSSAELDRLQIERRGDLLRVARKNDLSWGSHKGVKVFVTMPRLTAASITGSGDMAIDRVEGQAFAGEIAGSGTLDVAALKVESAKLATQGSGTLRVKGSATALDADISGSGDIEADGLAASSANVSVAGSGDLKAAVNGKASVSVMGSGDVDLGAGAHCTTSKMGSGDVHCGG